MAAWRQAHDEWNRVLKYNFTQSEQIRIITITTWSTKTLYPANFRVVISVCFAISIINLQ